MKPMPSLTARPAALHSTARSGYAVDVMPDIATNYGPVKGSVVPPASLTGAQAGVIPPGIKRYNQGQYEAVDAKEAMKRAVARSKGELPAIAGGLDAPKPGKATNPVADAAMKTAQTKQDQMINAITRTSQDIDPTDFGEPVGDMVGFEPQPINLPPISPTYPATVPSSTVQPSTVQPSTVPLSVWWDEASKWMKQRKRISMELPDSTVTLSAIDIIECGTGITVLLPVTPDGLTFIPKPGSALTLRYNDTEKAVYFPGAYFDMPALKLLGMSFVKGIVSGELTGTGEKSTLL